MANPEHVEVARQGAESLRAWREANDGAKLELRMANLSRAHLHEANLSGAYLNGANLSGADLTGADLSRALLHEANLKEADLSRAHLYRAHLHGANLHEANLSRAHLHEANLIEANLNEANLSGAYLNGADLDGADLTGANLSGADLTGARLTGANLDGANITQASLCGTVFGAVDLSEIQGLEEVKHFGPSHIDVDTLYKSRGKIPEIFLRGCGVPNNLITFLPSLTGSEKAFEFYSCFISYSHKNEDFAKQLHSRMQQEHLRVWYAPEDIKGGKKLEEQIDQAIRNHDKLLLVLSKESMESEWVITEIRKARDKESKGKRRRLFPIRLVDFKAIKKWKCFDADSGKDLAVEIREFFIPDFSNWKNHDSFEEGFARLLRDLRADEPTKGK